MTRMTLPVVYATRAIAPGGAGGARFPRRLPVPTCHGSQARPATVPFRAIPAGRAVVLRTGPRQRVPALAGFHAYRLRGMHRVSDESPRQAPPAGRPSRGMPLPIRRQVLHPSGCTETPRFPAVPECSPSLPDRLTEQHSRLRPRIRSMPPRLRRPAARLVPDIARTNRSRRQPNVSMCGCRTSRNGPMRASVQARTSLHLSRE